MSATAHQLINQTSGDVEYYTPMAIIEAAKAVMGTIDLDPASSRVANIKIGAANFYDEATDGLSQSWFGRVWMNHPFGRGTNKAWIKKLESEFKHGFVKEACCITYACTSEAWFRPLMLRPQCYLQPRTNYTLPDGTIKRGVTKGSVVTYYGVNVCRFADRFSHLGVIKIPLLAA